MPAKGELYEEKTVPGVIWEIVRMTENPLAAVLLSGGSGAYALREVPQSQWSLYRPYVPPVEIGQRWADRNGRTYEVYAVFDVEGTVHVAYSPVDALSLSVVPESTFRQHGTLLVNDI